MKFKTNDMIQYHGGEGTLGWIRHCDDVHYFITWMGSGDSMIHHDYLQGFEKVGEIEPGTSDELMFFGKVPFKR